MVVITGRGRRRRLLRRIRALGRGRRRLAAAAHQDLDEARTHAEAGRSWEQRAGLVTTEVDNVLTIIEAIAASRNGDRDRASALLDEAFSARSLLTAMLHESVAVTRLIGTAADPTAEGTAMQTRAPTKSTR